jgi:PTH1 family peptidyl-tRNA hydrolase
MPEQAIRLIAGLGNPGPHYADNRHNAGFHWIDLLASRHVCRLHQENRFHGLLGRCQVGGVDLRLLEPQTYMNHSGRAVVAVARYFDIPPQQILVAHDELDLPPGEVRLKQGGGHAGHNGLRDIMSALGSRDFWRLRIGIDHPADRSRVVDYVLSRPGKSEGAAIDEALERSADCLADILAGRFQVVMNRLHSAR